MSLTAQQILYLHSLALEYGGGAPGLRDLALLESAIGRALQTICRRTHLPTPWGRAAACAHSIARSHPFVDANKRTAFLVLGVWLEAEGFRWLPPETEAVQKIEQAATGALSADELGAWVSRYATPAAGIDAPPNDG